MFKQLVRFTVIGATVLALAACGNDQGAGGVEGDGFRATSRDGDGRLGANRYGVHNNRNLSMNPDVERAIEQIDGISRAHVVVGETNAYVAVELNEHGGAQQRRGTTGGNYAGVGNRGTRGGDNNVGTGAPGNGLIGGLSTGGVTKGNARNGGLSSSVTNFGTGTDDGKFDLNGDMDYREFRGMSTNQNFGYRGRSGRVGLNDTGMLGDRNTNMNGTAGDMADRYMYNGGAFGRRGGRTIGPAGANTNANANGLTPATRTLIERTVRSMVPDVRNVFVSADPAFIRQLNDFSDQMGENNGNGMRGLAAGFNQFVQSIFVEPFDNDNYDLNNRFNVRDRNGVTDTLDNTFTPTNRRNFGGLGFDGLTDNLVDTNRTPAGTVNTLR